MAKWKTTDAEGLDGFLRQFSGALVHSVATEGDEKHHTWSLGGEEVASCTQLPPDPKWTPPPVKEGEAPEEHAPHRYQDFKVRA